MRCPSCDHDNRAKAHLREHGRVPLRMLEREFALGDDLLDGTSAQAFQP